MTQSIFSLFVLAALLSLAIVPFVRWLGLRFGFVDDPLRARKVHSEPVPRLGGAAVLFAFLVACLVAELIAEDSAPFFGMGGGRGWIILVGAIFIFCVGLLDDLHRLSARVKLACEFGAAGFLVWCLDLGFERLDFLGFGQLWISEPVGFALACLWIAGMANAVNLIDGLDGLAAGITLCGLVAVAAVGYELNLLPVLWLSVLLIGSILGFLVFNSRPASIFLGDCGSLTLGFLVGVLSLMASQRGGGTIDAIFPVLAFAIPIGDASFAILRRILRGRSPFSPDKEHFHHRLMAKGLSHGRAVLTMWAIAAISAFVAIGAAFGRGDQLTALLVFFGLGGFILLRYLGYFRLHDEAGNLRGFFQKRESTKESEKAVGVAEKKFRQVRELDEIPAILGTLSERLGFEEFKMVFWEKGTGVGLKLSDSNAIGRRRVLAWKSSGRQGFYNEQSSLKAEWDIVGKSFRYGRVTYRFGVGRAELEVEEEILFERVHDAIADLASRIRKGTES